MQHVKKSFEYFNILGSFGVEDQLVGPLCDMRALHHFMLQGKLLRRRAGPQATVSWVLDQVAATEGLTVTLEAVGKAKASKGQCPDSKLFRIGVVALQRCEVPIYATK